MNKPLLIVMVSLLLSLVNAQESFDNRIDVVRPDAPELAHHGAFTIGVQTLNLINPEQLDILNAAEDGSLPSYDRPLTVEIWYPALLEEGQVSGGEYSVMTRDPTLEVTLKGLAVRNAAPDLAAGPYPLIIISHGYPGNRFLMSHLGENLATKGYVTVSIDHTDSTYSDQAAFGSTLLNRSLDQLFVLNEIARLSQDSESFLAGLVDAETTGLIGYSMGGYGVVNVVGGGYTEASVGFPWGTPGGALALRQAGNEAYLKSMDSRIKAAITFAPWGMNAGFWDAEGLAGIKTPILFIAGSADDVSGYDNGTKAIYDNAVNAERYLLTFENANHNAGAPIPAPIETWQASEVLPFIPAEHYADAVWDSLRLNNISQHFATAFLDKYLKQDESMNEYLDIIENAKDGLWSVDDEGEPNEDHSYWQGFPNRTAVGLSLMHALPQ